LIVLQDFKRLRHREGGNHEKRMSIDLLFHSAGN